jgi:hypothetical protein
MKEDKMETIVQVLNILGASIFGASIMAIGLALIPTGTNTAIVMTVIRPVFYFTSTGILSILGIFLMALSVKRVTKSKTEISEIDNV